jgi:SSS family solute:Na+ symporter
MSSLSSGINSSSLTIIDDFILNLKLKSLSEKRKIKLAQFISLMIGVVIVLLSLVIANIRGNLLELTYRTSNLFVAPLFVPFFMAMFIKKAKSNATFTGTLLSGITAIFISFSKELFNTDISFLWIIPVSLIVGITVSIFLSYYSHILSFEKNK